MNTNLCGVSADIDQFLTINAIGKDWPARALNYNVICIKIGSVHIPKEIFNMPHIEALDIRFANSKLVKKYEYLQKRRIKNLKNLIATRQIGLLCDRFGFIGVGGRLRVYF